MLQFKWRFSFHHLNKPLKFPFVIISPFSCSPLFQNFVTECTGVNDVWVFFSPTSPLSNIAKCLQLLKSSKVAKFQYFVLLFYHFFLENFDQIENVFWLKNNNTFCPNPPPKRFVKNTLISPTSHTERPSGPLISPQLPVSP